MSSTLTNDLIRKVHSIKRNNKKLSREETINFLRELKSICKDEILIKKIIEILDVLDSSIYHTLSPREHQIFNLIGLSLSSKEISQKLGIAKSTVSTHRKNIIKKLKLSGQGQLGKVAHDKVFEVKKESIYLPSTL